MVQQGAPWIGPERGGNSSLAGQAFRGRSNCDMGLHVCAGARLGRHVVLTESAG